MIRKKVKEYNKPMIVVLGKIKSQTQGQVGETCDGSGSLGSGSNSNASACKS